MGQRERPCFSRRPLKPRPRWKFGEIAGFGGITSTADDLAKFLAYQLNPHAYPNVLDTNATLEAAQALYRSSGYGEIEPYNDNPNATHWFRKEL